VQEAPDRLYFLKLRLIINSFDVELKRFVPIQAGARSGCVEVEASIKDRQRHVVKARKGLPTSLLIGCT